jgi:hypothetical protein
MPHRCFGAPPDLVGLPDETPIDIYCLRVGLSSTQDEPATLRPTVTTIAAIRGWSSARD